ncbi:MAG: S8 family serine peptidase [Oscillospiraceae bacterium]|nr:S8 family serine peptidase [Oscillospiraceae bacterium]
MKKSKQMSLLAIVLVLALTVTMLSGMAIATGSKEIDFAKIDNAKLSGSALTLENPDALTDEEQGLTYKADETVRVYVAMSQASAIDAGFSTKGLMEDEEALAYMDGLKAVQKEVARDIMENVITDGSFDVNYNLSIVADAFSANVKYGDLEMLETYLADTYGEAFAGIYIVPQYEIMEDEEVNDPNMGTAGDMVGASTAWSEGYTGAGSRVAIIDTGLDTDHPSYDPDAFLYSLNLTALENGKNVADYNLLTAEEIESVLPLLNATARYKESKKKDLTASDLYRNEKLAFAFNYVDRDLDVTHDNDTEGDHGSHVSGIATANLFVKKVAANGAISFVHQENKVAGVAPDAQLLTMKVFGKMGGAYNDDYMAAIEDALLLNCDAVNLSLGSGVPGRSYGSTAYIDGIFDSLVGCDTVISISAGNNSHWAENNYANDEGLNFAEDVSQQTGGTPGAYTNSFTVASAVNSGITGKGGNFEGITVVGTNPGSHPEDMKDWGELDTSADYSGTTYEYVFLGDPTNADDTVKYGGEGAFEGLDVAGKVVLISRGGGVSFYQKQDYAQAAGAAAAVIYNNANGSISMDLSDSSSQIPCVSILQADASKILAVSSKQESGMMGGKVTICNKVQISAHPDGYTMSDFSSWGTTGNLAIKPEITAPGGNIYSTLTDGAYGLMSGTSMAAPSIAGQSALVAQYIRENNLTEKTGLSARTLGLSLLMSTAVPLTDPASNLPFSVRHQGAGLASAARAVESPAYILMDENATVCAADGKVKAELGDDAEKKGVYSFSFTVYNLTNAPLTYVPDAKVLTPEILHKDSGSYMSTSETALDPIVTYGVEGAAGTTYLYDFNGDGEVDRLDAQYLSDFVAGIKTLSKEAEAAADFNCDGIVDSLDVYIMLTLLEGEKEDGISLNKSSSKILLAPNGSAKVTVTVELTENDRKYFADNTPNGGYVEGYIGLSGSNELSIPFLAFYGNYTDASMFDRASYLDYLNGLSDKASYVKENSQVNLLTLKVPGVSSTPIFGFNLYADEESFSPEQNYVLSATSGAGLYQALPTLIRTTARMETTISNAETGEVYYTTFSAPSAAYYNSNSGAWAGTSSTVRLGSGSAGWKGVDAEGNPLPDGTVVNVTCTAAPELYTFKDEAGNLTIDKEKLGKGASWTTTLTMDNTAPEIQSVYYADDLWGNNDYLTITVKDNRYVAAVILFNEKGNTALARTAVPQTELGETTEVRLNLGEDVKGSHFVLAAVDYAGNLLAGELDLTSSGREDGENPEEKPDTNVYAVVKDANGALAWSTVNVDEATATKVSAFPVDLDCGTYYGGKIYGNADGTLYTINAKTKEPEAGMELAAAWNFTDISYTPSYGQLILTCGTKFAMMEPGSSQLSAFDLSSNLNGETLVGVSYMFTAADSTGVDADYFGLITNTGAFYVFYIYETAEGFGGGLGSYGTIGVAANADMHSQGLSYNRNDDFFYYSVGAKLYRIGFTGSSSNLKATARLLGAVSGAESVLAVMQLQDAPVASQSATETQSIVAAMDASDFTSVQSADYSSLR